MNKCDIISLKKHCFKKVFVMKCIFLDFDGVINNWNHFTGVSEDNARVLKHIINITAAKVIVTSSNKYELQRNDTKEYYASNFYKEYVKPLNDFGVEIYDITRNINGNRTLEIQKYIAEHNISEYVILDDELVDPILEEHQVFLDLYKGLQEEHIVPAIEILNGNLGFYPKEYNKSESPAELVKRINAYYNEKQSN